MPASTRCRYDYCRHSSRLEACSRRTCCPSSGHREYSEFSLPPDPLEQLESFRGLRVSAFAKEFWAAYTLGRVVAILVDNLVVPTFFGGHALFIVNAIPIPAGAAATNGQYPIVIFYRAELDVVFGGVHNR